MTRWQKQVMYVLRSDTGVIVGISETVPSQYKETTKETLREAYRASSKKLSEYQRKQIEKKRVWMGGD